MWRPFKAKSISSVKRKSLWNTTGRDECILILRDFHYERNLNNLIWKLVLKWFFKIDLSSGLFPFYHWMWPKRNLKIISPYRLLYSVQSTLCVPKHFCSESNQNKSIIFCASWLLWLLHENHKTSDVYIVSINPAPTMCIALDQSTWGREGLVSLTAF